jgi:hypothetical protein
MDSGEIEQIFISWFLSFSNVSQLLRKVGNLSRIRRWRRQR